VTNSVTIDLNCDVRFLQERTVVGDQPNYSLTGKPTCPVLTCRDPNQGAVSNLTAQVALNDIHVSGSNVYYLRLVLDVACFCIVAEFLLRAPASLCQSAQQLTLVGGRPGVFVTSARTWSPSNGMLE